MTIHDDAKKLARLLDYTFRVPIRKYVMLSPKWAGETQRLTHSGVLHFLAAFGRRYEAGKRAGRKAAMPYPIPKPLRSDGRLSHVLPESGVSLVMEASGRIKLPRKKQRRKK